MAGELRGKVAAAGGVGWERVDFDVFEVELFYAEDRAVVRCVLPEAYEDAEVTIGRFLEALPG